MIREICSDKMRTLRLSIPATFTSRALNSLLNAHDLMAHAALGAMMPVAQANQLVGRVQRCGAWPHRWAGQVDRRYAESVGVFNEAGKMEQRNWPTTKIYDHPAYQLDLCEAGVSGGLCRNGLPAQRAGSPLPGILPQHRSSLDKWIRLPDSTDESDGWLGRFDTERQVLPVCRCQASLFFNELYFIVDNGIVKAARFVAHSENGINYVFKLIDDQGTIVRSPHCGLLVSTRRQHLEAFHRSSQLQHNTTMNRSLMMSLTTKNLLRTHRQTEWRIIIMIKIQ